MKNFFERPIFKKLLYFCNSTVSLMLAACGANKTTTQDISQPVGLSSSYNPPDPDYTKPELIDPNFKKLQPDYVEPYWVASLSMENGEEVISDILGSSGGVIGVSFPNVLPEYVPVSITGWAPANETMVNASMQIFEELNRVLKTKFEISSDSTVGNIISISQSIQPNTAGFSYFPNKFYELGSDVFISKSYSNPHYLPNGLTNYDYEVLIHEIGHSLGLKHPFDRHLSNDAVLDIQEDQTTFTSMSYVDFPHTFSGTFRVLDWMALTKLYGVNETYRSGDNTYFFDLNNGTFIVDGGGTDVLDCSAIELNSYVDLRSGSHSYVNEKSSFITSNGQLTISHGTVIENVKTGSGADVIIGNEHKNLISSGEGDDIIFAGEGADTIIPGVGINFIDLSENTNLEDILFLEKGDFSENFNIIYGFSQGQLGDKIYFAENEPELLIFLPLVDIMNVPNGNIDGCLVRVYGENLDNKADIEMHFNNANTMERLVLPENRSAILLTAISKETGEDQYLFRVSNEYGELNVNQIARFSGNYLDIDNWAPDNFFTI